MPQIIDLRQDPGAEATQKAIQSAGELAADVMHKKQQMAIWKLDAQIRAKQAQTEEAKGKADREVQFISALGSLGDLGVLNEKTGPQVISNLSKRFGVETFDFMSNGSEIMDFKTPQGRVHTAQAKNLGTQSDLMQGVMSQMQNGGGAGAPPIPGGMPPGASPRLNSMQGGFQPTAFKMGPSGIDITMTNPEFEARQKEVESAATAKGSLAGKNEYSQPAFEGYLGSMEQVAKIIPPPKLSESNVLGNTMTVLKRGAGLGLQGFSQTGQVGKAYSMYNDWREKAAALIGRRFDVGNLSTYEQQSAKNLIPNLAKDSGEVRAIKFAFLHQLSGIPNNATSAPTVQKLVNDFTMKLFAAKNPDTPKAGAINRAQAIQGGSPMETQAGFDPSKMSDDELRALTGGQ